MKCSLNLIEAYLDEELDAAQHFAMEQHLEGCPDCSKTYARLREQRIAIKTAGPYYNAPPALAQSIRAALRREAMPHLHTPQSTRKTPWRAIAWAACLLLAISISWNVRQLKPPATENSVSDNLLADHIRSLLGTRLVDVASSDQHTVKPWFTGKLDFSPVVKDFKEAGFTLAGGRMEYVAGRRVAALVYYRRRHVINLFTWPDTSPASAGPGISRNGYNVLRWNDGAMVYWAVSDVAMADLKAFRGLYEQGVTLGR